MTSICVDSPWAWATVFGAFIANVIIGGLSKSFGLIVEAYKEILPGPDALYLLTGGLIYSVMLIFSLFTHLIVDRIGPRPVVIFGAICSCIFLIIAASVQSIELWVTSLGLGVGISLACIYFNVISITGKCFRRYLGIANGISLAGVSIGQMVFPSIITFLIDHYSARGGTYLMAGIFLQMVITGVLMPQHIIDPAKPSEGDEIEIKGSTSFSRASSRTNMTLKKTYSSSKLGSQLELRDLCPKESNNILNGHIVNHQNNNDLVILQDNILYKPMEDLNNNLLAKHDSLNQIQNSNTNLTTNSFTYKSLTEVRQYKMYIILLITYVVSKTFADIADVGISMVAPPFGLEFKFDQQTQINMAILISGVFDLLSRLFVGWLCDQRWIVGHRSYLMASFWFLEALNSLLWAEISHYPWIISPHYIHAYKDYTNWQLVAYMSCFAIHGLCSGAAMTLMVVVLIDFVGPDHLAQSLAITFIIVGIFYVPSFYLIGQIRAWTNSFAWSIRLMAFFLLISGLILLFELPTRFVLDDPISAKNRKLRLLREHSRESEENSSYKLSLNGQPKFKEHLAISVDGMTPPIQRWVS